MSLCLSVSFSSTLENLWTHTCTHEHLYAKKKGGIKKKIIKISLAKETMITKSVEFNIHEKSPCETDVCTCMPTNTCAK